MSLHYETDSVRLHHADCLDVLRELPDASVDAVVTDPPYGLEFMGKEWDGANGFRRSLNPADTERDNPFGRTSRTSPEYRAGTTFQQWCEAWATECLRVLKPGGHLLAFGGTRTFHRLACAVEDAGFEIRDSLAWMHGSGFPKSLRVSRDERYCHCDASVHTSSHTSPVPETVDHTRTADASAAVADAERSVPRGSNEPLDSLGDCHPALDSGGAPLHLAVTDAPALPQLRGYVRARSRSGELADGQGDESSRSPFQALRSGHPSSLDSDRPSRSLNDESTHRQASTSLADTSESADRTPDNPLSSSPSYGTGFPVCTRCDKPNVDGLGTALKPAFEPVVCARKPLIGTVAANVLTHGTGALNVDGCRIEHASEADRRANDVAEPGMRESRSAFGGGLRVSTNPAGRWPANVVLDESQADALDQMSGTQRDGVTIRRNRDDGTEQAAHGVYGSRLRGPEPDQTYGGEGGASRFFYTAKADAAERVRINGTAHPTVKPLALMRWLVRLVCPPGGIVLEPFAGSGTTVEACILEGFGCIAIEREADYLPLIRQRIDRRIDPVAAVKASGDDGGLFDLLEEETA